MGLKSTVNPGAIVVVDHLHGDATPSVTPMRPTPLVGNWCDLPWGGDEGASPAQTPGTIHAATLKHDVNFHSAVPATTKAPAPAKSLLVDPIATMMPTHSTSLDHAPLQRSNTDVPPSDESSSDGEFLHDLYLGTPGASLLPEDFEVEAQQPPTTQHHRAPSQAAPPVAFYTQQPYLAAVVPPQHTMNFAVPSRASHFVDFRRLPQQHMPQVQLASQQPMIRVQIGAAPQAPRVLPAHAPAMFQYCQQDVRASLGGLSSQTSLVPSMSLHREGALVHHGVHARYAQVEAAVQAAPQGRPVNGVSLVLISRFPPPPPPSLENLQVFLRTGSTFDAYYAIVMRWYKKVGISAPRAHPQVPMCPSAEHYLHDFEGWVREINSWWQRYFTRRPRGARGGSKKERGSSN